MAQLLGDMIPESNVRTMYEISQALNLDPIENEIHEGHTLRVAAMKFFEWATRNGNANGWNVNSLDNHQLSQITNDWMLFEHVRFASMAAQMSHEEREKARV